MIERVGAALSEHDRNIAYGGNEGIAPASRTRNRSVEVGDSMQHFLEQRGMSIGGGARGGYVTPKQMNVLAACRLSLGMEVENRVVTVDAKPIRRFEAWINPGRHDEAQRTLWPGVLELSQEFYDTLTNYAVPLDYRALAGLHHSALALDIYTWLAHRLWRIKRPQGTKVSWGYLREQFGQEYASPKNFKREFVAALRQVMILYLQARVSECIGGLLLLPSRPPLSRTMFSLSTPAAPTPPVDKSGL